MSPMFGWHIGQLDEEKHISNDWFRSDAEESDFQCEIVLRILYFLYIFFSYEYKKHYTWITNQRLSKSKRSLSLDIKYKVHLIRKYCAVFWLAVSFVFLIVIRNNESYNWCHVGFSVIHHHAVWLFYSFLNTICQY